MKRFLKKRWLGLPIGIITVVLLVLVLTGTALAVNGYVFFEGKVDAEVKEAIVVGAFDTWDNLHPYGSNAEAVWVDTVPGAGELGDVTISIVPEGEGVYTLTIVGGTTVIGEGYAGTGFVAGEWIVIPINLRNGSSVALDLGATAEAVGLELDYCWRTNTGALTGVESGQNMARNFKDDGKWESLDVWAATIAGYGGKSGSAVQGAEVLFVKITVPQDAAPGAYGDITFSLARGVN